jgi:hypothetical protein
VQGLSLFPQALENRFIPRDGLHSQEQRFEAKENGSLILRGVLKQNV